MRRTRWLRRGGHPPRHHVEAFAALAARGRIDLELAKRLGRAAGLRNLLVHDYVSVDLERLAQVVREDMGDLRAFATVAAGWITPAGG